MVTELPRPQPIDPASVPSLSLGRRGYGMDRPDVHPRRCTPTPPSASAPSPPATPSGRRGSRPRSASTGRLGRPLSWWPTPTSTWSMSELRTPPTVRSRCRRSRRASTSSSRSRSPCPTAEGAEIAAAAHAAGVFVMEAMWTRYLPQSDIIRRLLADGAIGEVDLVMADFGFVIPYDPKHRMWDPALGGGALLDAGVYPLSFASSVIGPPARITASGAMTSTGVDARAAIALTTPSGANALVATSMVSALPVRGTIVGSEGRIEIPSPFFGPTGVQLVQGSADSETTLELDRRHLRHGPRRTQLPGDRPGLLRVRGSNRVAAAQPRRDGVDPRHDRRGPTPGHRGAPLTLTTSAVSPAARVDRRR